jgi:hypothetical protein
MTFHGPLLGPGEVRYDDARVLHNAVFDPAPGRGGQGLSRLGDDVHLVDHDRTSDAELVDHFGGGVVGFDEELPAEGRGLGGGRIEESTGRRVGRLGVGGRTTAEQ